MMPGIHVHLQEGECEASVFIFKEAITYLERNAFKCSKNPPAVCNFAQLLEIKCQLHGTLLQGVSSFKCPSEPWCWPIQPQMRNLWFERSFPPLLLNTRITFHSISVLSPVWAQPLFPTLRFSWNFSSNLSSWVICCRSLDICLGNVLVRCSWMKDCYFQSISFSWPTWRAHTPSSVVLPPAVCFIASSRKNSHP